MVERTTVAAAAAAAGEVADKTWGCRSWEAVFPRQPVAEDNSCAAVQEKSRWAEEDRKMSCSPGATWARLRYAQRMSGELVQTWAAAGSSSAPPRAELCCGQPSSLEPRRVLGYSRG